MAEKKRSKASSAGVWIIVGLLMLGMVGFGAAGLSGTARSIGTVGDKQVSVQNYYNALSNNVRLAEQQLGRSLSGAEIQALGLDRQALADVVAIRALDQSATDLGVSVGDAAVRDEILAIPAFVGLTGEFDRQGYAQTLEQNGFSESEFETSVRETAARDILQLAVVGDFQAPNAYAETLAKFAGETRDFAWVKVKHSDLSTGTPVPSDEDLIAFYTENGTQFQTPAAKRIDYIWVTPEMIVDNVDVSDAEIAEIYEERAAQYNRPELRIVDRLIFPDAASAQAAIDAIESGSQTFEDAVTARGLTLQDVELGDVEERSLGDVGPAVFGANEPGVVGPLPTDLGPALFRISAILDAQTTTLEDISDDLRREIALQKAEQALLVEAEDINDLLAGGATLAEVADESTMVAGQVDWHPGSTGGINDYAEFRDTARGLTAEDFPDLIDLPDGGFFAVEFVEDIPETLPAFDVVKADVQAAWEEQARTDALNDYVDELIDGLGDAQLSSLGFITVQESDMGRTEFIEDVTPALIGTVFDMDLNEVRKIEDADGIVIAQVGAIFDADLSTDESENLQALITQTLSGQMAQDVFNSFARGVQNDLDTNLNQQTIASVTSQLRGGAHR